MSPRDRPGNRVRPYLHGRCCARLVRRTAGPTRGCESATRVILPSPASPRYHNSPTFTSQTWAGSLGRSSFPGSMRARSTDPGAHSLRVSVLDPLAMPDSPLHCLSELMLLIILGFLGDVSPGAPGCKLRVFAGETSDDRTGTSTEGHRRGYGFHDSELRRTILHVPGPGCKQRSSAPLPDTNSREGGPVSSEPALLHHLSI